MMSEKSSSCSRTFTSCEETHGNHMTSHHPPLRHIVVTMPAMPLIRLLSNSVKYICSLYHLWTRYLDKTTASHKTTKIMKAHPIGWKAKMPNETFNGTMTN